jgi:hypothetical protein
MLLNNFILSSDYASLKNDTQSNIISVTIPFGMIFNSGTNNILGSSTLIVGTINAGIRARGNSSKYAKWVSGTTIYVNYLFTIPSIPAAGTQTGTLYCNLQRISSNTMQLIVATDQDPGAPDFKIAETQTITFVFSTFLSPFN